MDQSHKKKKPAIQKMEDSDVSIETTPFYIIRSRVVINPIKKVKNPTQALFNLGIRMNLDAVKLVKEARDEL